MAFFASCAGPAKKSAPIEVTVDAVRMEPDVYRVTLHIPRNIREKLDTKTMENLAYRPDSSIYLKGEKGKAYPLYIEPVANGNTQEIVYLAEFDQEDRGNAKLFYADKYINQKIYPLQIR